MNYEVITACLASYGMTVDHDADTPVYRQLAEILKEKIRARVWAERRPIPSEKQLQQEYGVGRQTVRHALLVLREEGYVYTVPQRGTYVSPQEQWRTFP